VVSEPSHDPSLVPDVLDVRLHPIQQEETSSKAVVHVVYMLHIIPLHNTISRRLSRSDLRLQLGTDIPRRPPKTATKFQRQLQFPRPVFCPFGDVA
jgi:hypothetical protein